MKLQKFLECLKVSPSTKLTCEDAIECIQAAITEGVITLPTVVDVDEVEATDGSVVFNLTDDQGNQTTATIALIDNGNGTYSLSIGDVTAPIFPPSEVTAGEPAADGSITYTHQPSGISWTTTPDTDTNTVSNVTASEPDENGAITYTHQPSGISWTTTPGGGAAPDPGNEARASDFAGSDIQGPFDRDYANQEINEFGYNAANFGNAPSTGESLRIGRMLQKDGLVSEYITNAETLEGNKIWVDAVTGQDARPYVINGKNFTANAYDSDRPFKTIQAAIDAAKAGDTVHIRPGVYPENIMTLKDRVDMYFDDNTLLTGGVINDNGTGGVNVDISGHGDFNLLLGFRIYEGSNVRIEADRVWRTDIGALVRPQLDVRNAGSKVRIHVREEFMSEYACIFCLNGGEIISTGVGPRVQNVTHGTASVAVIQAGSTYKFHYDTPMVLDSPNPASTVGGIGHQVFKVVSFGNTVIGSAPGYRNNAPYLSFDATYGGGNTDSGSILNFNGISGSTVGNYVEITSWGESRANGPMVSYANIFRQPSKTILRDGAWVQEAGSTVAPIRGNRAVALNCTLCLAVETMTRDGNTGAAAELLSDFTVATNNQLIFRRPLGHNYGGGLDANATVVAEVIPNAAVFDIDFE